MSAATVDTTRWLCRPCGTEFIDEEGTQPCPRCGNANPQSIEALDGIDAQAVEQARKVMKPGVVKSAPLTNGKSPGKKTAAGGTVWERLPGWLIGSLLLGLWWAIGGKYTIEGLPLLGNLFFGWFHVPVRIAPITDGRWYLWLCWLPLLISFVERQYRPWTSRAILARERFWLVLLWLAVVALDAGATYLAVRNPAPDAWTLTQQVAASWALAATWSLMTTFGPESGLSWLWRWLRGA
jgi:hypothetical protein